MPPALLPSTRNSSDSAGSREVQSASLPGSAVFSSAPLRRIRSRALRAAWRARAGVDGLVDDRAGVVRVLLEELRRASRSSVRLDHALRIDGLPSLVFVWPSNCGSRSLTEMIAARPSQHVVAGQVLVLLLEQALLARVGVERARQRGLEAGEVRAALDRVDVVREREDGRVVARRSTASRPRPRPPRSRSRSRRPSRWTAIPGRVDVARRSRRCRPRSGTRLAGPRRARRAASSRRPSVRNAISRMRWASIVERRTRGLSKMSRSAQERDRRAASRRVSSPCSSSRHRLAALEAAASRRRRPGAPRRSSHSESAFTTETPTPCRPPETL